MVKIIVVSIPDKKDPNKKVLKVKMDPSFFQHLNK